MRAERAPLLAAVMAVVAAGALAGIVPLLVGPPGGDDAYYHAMNAQQHGWCWRHGVLHPRWYPGLNAGLGGPEPRTRALAPLALHAALAVALDDAVAAIALASALIPPLAGLVMFLAVRRRVAGSEPAVLAGIAWAMAPYLLLAVHPRASLQEAWALVLLPAVLAAFLAPAPGAGAPPATRALLLGLLIATHLLVAAMAGAVLLAWIGIKMLVPDDGEEEIDGSAYLWAAIKTIIVADFIMSLDNVLGVAAAAKGSVVLLVIGLGISIPIIVYGSTLVLKLMTRFPVIVTIGGGVLGWVAGEMLVSDPALKPWIDGRAHWLHDLAPAMGAILVVLTGKTHAALTVAAARHALDVQPAEPQEKPIPGYRWHGPSLPQRDYAAYCGTGEFRVLRPVSSRMRSAARWKSFSRA